MGDPRASNQNLSQDAAANVGETVPPALVFVGQARVIDSETMEEGGL